MPRVFNLNLHYACNNACKDCISHNTRASSRGGLTLGQVENMLLRYDPQEGDLVILSGGEPSIYPGLRSLLETIRTHSTCAMVMYSNGSGLCSPDTAEAVAHYVDRVTFSCYGDEVVHDRHAGREGAFATLAEAVDRLCRARKNLENACALELKYVRAVESVPVLPLLNELALPEQVGSVVLSRMLPVENGNSAVVGHDAAAVRDIMALQTHERWSRVPLKLVDMLPCSLSRDLFDAIRADSPQRAMQEVIFFDGTHPHGKPIRFARLASFTSRCASCDLQAICGTTVTCYGALRREQGRWGYAEE
ncbi:radical SAM protein [Nitratidesulfovibrio sp. 1201_IL3209]|uniref:radical SAM protein n=1 Tax=Nitratidesulfovibrio sp. 1201_IL3209 TaxID=3084053 RepID=UPI002FDA668F